MMEYTAIECLAEAFALCEQARDASTDSRGKVAIDAAMDAVASAMEECKE